MPFHKHFCTRNGNGLKLTVRKNILKSSFETGAKWNYIQKMLQSFHSVMFYFSINASSGLRAPPELAMNMQNEAT